MQEKLTFRDKRDPPGHMEGFVELRSRPLLVSCWVMKPQRQMRSSSRVPACASGYFSCNILTLHRQNIDCPVPDSQKYIYIYSTNVESCRCLRGKESFRAALVWSWWNSTGWLTSGCPPNKALLRKQHQQQPRQRACRRETRRNSPSPPASLRPSRSRLEGSAVAPLRCSA